MEKLWIVMFAQYKFITISPFVLIAVVYFRNWFFLGITGFESLIDSIRDVVVFLLFFALAIEIIQFIFWVLTWIFTSGVMEQKW